LAKDLTPKNRFHIKLFRKNAERLAKVLKTPEKKLCDEQFENSVYNQDGGNRDIGFRKRLNSICVKKQFLGSPAKLAFWS